MMKKINFKILIITTLVCLLPIFSGLYYYDSLPDQMAIHFNLEGEADGYASKAFFAIGLPICMAVLQVIVCLTSDLCDNEKEANKKTISVLKWFIPILTFILFTTTINYSINGKFDVSKIALILVGLIFVVTGNYVPKTKGSYVIHVPRTQNEKLNKKVARIIGCIFIILGILFVVAAFFESIRIISLIAILISIVLIVIITIRCIIEDVRLKNNKE